MNAADVVGYAYDADVHCEDCARARFGDGLDNNADDVVDSEGNPINPIFDTEDAFEDCPDCKGGTEAEHDCSQCGNTHEGCPTCDSQNVVSRRCGDCGKELTEV